MGEMMFGFEFLPYQKSKDIEHLKAMIEGARGFLQEEVGFVLIPANVRKNAGVNAILSAYMLREHIDVVFVPTISAAGLDKIQIRSQILSLKYANFTCVALIGGDEKDNRSENKKIDGIELIEMTREILGSDIHIISGTPTDMSNPLTRKRLAQKMRLGVDRIITQPIFSSHLMREFIRDFEELRSESKSKAKLSLGVFGLFSAQSAEVINAAHLGFEVPKDYVEMLQKCAKQGSDDAALAAFKHLWVGLQSIAREHNVSLYLSTPKHNDLRAYGKYMEN
ncbi:hypothetical protein OQH61_00335 [Helicobacter sp. MIT 21-1697]|uniref:hypothetical protein n=1 Tax=Helicobacter sp. MIT 21-1697 TaxID=2993733 RepID=UPI00224A55B3|nr:hypothetical protein [Helicobacter sp. MIT 21-1697]MCX2716188.1 hypothetical protein [Helicobacter sp. MIT 21-1697]